MRLEENFDAVLFLTWSDWKNEPRSNRFHYATRFAKVLPVLFLQHCHKAGTVPFCEPSGVPNVDIVNVGAPISAQNVAMVKELLYARGIKRPLIWIYDSIHYFPLLDAMPKAFRVYHATEDYFTPTAGWHVSVSELLQPLVKLLRQVDFLVACSTGVMESYLRIGGYKGPCSVVENGCDAEFFLQRTEASGTDAQFPNIAIFQGGINRRLDYPLLIDLAQRMPDWEFHFYGHVLPNKDWLKLIKLSNVKEFSSLAPEELALRMHEATVGLIPFVQDTWIYNSFPLKAYEYVACGLPVVTVPIRAFERAPELFSVATTAEEFERMIRDGAKSRHDPHALKSRTQSALLNSYDERFEQTARALSAAHANLQKRPARRKIAVLYDSVGSMHVSTIVEHLEAIEKYSKHDVSFIPATRSFWNNTSIKVQQVDLSIFDVVIVHYSIRLSIANHLDDGLAKAVSSFNGLKILFIQDEYDNTEMARGWLDRLRFDIVYTCVPNEYVEFVYPSYRFPGTDFLQTLTGYVPEHPTLELLSQPLAERAIAIAYRGRQLDSIYGRLGQEKFQIGERMKYLALERGLNVDIETDESKRIYGDAWYEFLGAAKATLGTESGSNIFDFDGSLKAKIACLKRNNAQISFEEIFETVLAPHEGRVCMNQVSPKIFEAIRLRTALILFEGHYSGVVCPEEHYIPLKKDFSNIEEVLRKLCDDTYLEALTERAYRDVVASGRYSYRSFVEQLDLHLDARFSHHDRDILVKTVHKVSNDGKMRLVLPALPVGLWAGDNPLKFRGTKARIMDRIFAGRTMAWSSVLREIPYRVTKYLWRKLPVSMRISIKRDMWLISKRGREIVIAAARLAWRMLPTGLRTYIRRYRSR